MANLANPLDTTTRAAMRTAGDIWLTALTYWYLTGLIAALGFSLGFSLLRPGAGTVADKRDWLDAFTWMDGRWYKQIAATGYEYDPDKNANVAFFPVYPLVGRAVIRLTGMRAEAALLIVSNLSLLGALAMLAFYVRDRYPDLPSDLADYTVLAAALFPTGCFFRLTYSESTFLLLAILAMYSMLRRWPLWAIVLIVGLVTAARPVGVALLAPFAIHIVRRSSSVSFRGRLRESAVEGSGSNLPLPLGEGRGEGLCVRLGPALRCLALYMPLACWGLAAFIVYQYFAFDEPLAFARVQKNWGRPAVDWHEKFVPLVTLQPVWSVYDSRSTSFWAQRDEHGIPWFSLQLSNPILYVAAAVAVALGACLSVREGAGDGLAQRSSPTLWEKLGTNGRLSLEEVSLSALLLVIPYVTRAYEMGMGSMGRFVAVVFPVHLVLGQLLVRLPSGLRAALLALAAFLLSSYTGLYAAKYLIF
jgi:hypothetical protein